jgi:hypothetical protein
MSYYLAKVKVATDTPKGVKWQTESYLVNAATVTHAEALINEEFQQGGVDFDVKSISSSSIIKVVESKK